MWLFLIAADAIDGEALEHLGHDDHFTHHDPNAVY